MLKVLYKKGHIKNDIKGWSLYASINITQFTMERAKRQIHNKYYFKKLINCQIFNKKDLFEQIRILN